MTSLLELECIKESTLIADNEQDLIVPPRFRKIKIQDKKIIIDNDTDFFNTIESLRFHIIKKLPDEIYNYVQTHKVNLDRFKDFFHGELTLLMNSDMIDPKSTIMIEAAKHGFLDLIKYLFKNDFKFTYQSAKAAIENNQMECLKFMIENDCPYDSPNSWDGGLCAIATRFGHLEILKYLRQVGIKWTDFIMSAAACSDQVHILEYLYKVGAPSHQLIMSNVLSSGSLKCIKFMRENGHEWSSYDLDCVCTFDEAVKKCVLYALEDGCPCSIEIVGKCIRANEFDFLKVLFEYYYDPDPSEKTWFCSRAAIVSLYRYKKGCYDDNIAQKKIDEITEKSLQILKYLRQKGYGWNHRTTKKAAKTGNLKCLEYACENGCEMNLETIIGAIQGGYINCINYAFEHTVIENANVKDEYTEMTPFEKLCDTAYDTEIVQIVFDQIIKYNQTHSEKVDVSKWSDKVTHGAASRNHCIDKLKMLVEFGYSVTPHTVNCAACYGNLDALKFLNEKGYRSDDACTEAARYGNLECLTWLHENDYKWDKKTYYYALRNRKDDCVYYFEDYYCVCEHDCGDDCRDDCMCLIDIDFSDIVETY